MEDRALAYLLLKLVHLGYDIRFEKGFLENTIIIKLSKDMQNLDFTVSEEEIRLQKDTTPGEMMVFILEKMEKKFLETT